MLRVVGNFCEASQLGLEPIVPSVAIVKASNCPPQASVSNFAW